MAKRCRERKAAMVGALKAAGGTKTARSGGKIVNLRAGVMAVALATASFLFARQARAVLVGGGSLDWLISNAHIVVKARVVSIGTSSDFEHLAFTIAPLAVLKGTAEALPQRITVAPASPIWPDGLGHPYKEGAVALFFLRKQGECLVVENNVNAILPAVKAPSVLSARYDLKEQILKELLPVLSSTKSTVARARLLILLSQIAAPMHEHIFEPYLRDDNVWVRRAAAAALLRLDPTPERVTQASSDFKAFLATPQEPADTWLFWDLYANVLEDRQKPRQEQGVALLELYRTIADVTALAPQDKNDLRGAEAVVHGLARANRREDALRLYRYASASNAYVRHQALEALCQMLGIPLRRLRVTSYMMPLDPSVVEQEKQTQEVVREALKREGLLRP